jgi:hypothetical protein
MAREMSRSAPDLAAEMRWLETNDKEGKKPDGRSALVRDYGPVLRHDFGGRHESYAHLQNISGRWNYRRGNAGIVYYGARGKVWSWNGGEANGDDFNWDHVTAFSVKGKGLPTGPTDGPLYDFGFAQFYRAAAPAGAASAYRSRGLMLVRDDYLVLYDRVAPDTEGQFVWASVFEMPQIYQLKPGAAVKEYTHTEGKARPGAPPPRTAKVRKYVGKGDFLTAVAPAAVKAEARPYGAVIDGEHVFAAGRPVEVKLGTVVFQGTMGHARRGQLALFEGSRLGLDGFEVRREGGDFGISAAAGPKAIVGRIAGRQGGRVFVTPPRGYDAARAKLTVDGKPARATVEKGAIVFDVTISLRDGCKEYRIGF